VKQLFKKVVLSFKQPLSAVKATLGLARLIFSFQNRLAPGHAGVSLGFGLLALCRDRPVKQIPKAGFDKDGSQVDSDQYRRP
jgi:hypothetical protein